MCQSRISRETWEQVKIAYVAGAGLREIARKMSIPEGTVLAHAKRKGWTQQIEAAKEEVKPQSNAITPMQALATTLNERKDRSRLHLSKYVAEASEEAANANNKLKIAGNVRDLSNVMEKLWPDQAKAESKLTLNLLSQNTAISIDKKDPDNP
jgi:hypothetical protein